MSVRIKKDSAKMDALKNMIILGRAHPPQKKKPQKSNYLVEDDIKKQFISGLKLAMPKVLEFLIPLDLYAVKCTIGQAMKWQALGAQKGVADYFLMIPSVDTYTMTQYNGLFIEFKRPKIYGVMPVGRQTPEQKDFQKRVESMAYKYIVAYSTTDAMIAIKQYLNRPGYGLNLS